MTTLLATLGFLALFLGVFPLWMTIRLRHYVDQCLTEPTAQFTPMVSLIVPCKGTDLEFERNVEAVLQQDYPRYEVIFVTATTADPAYETLARFAADKRWQAADVRLTRRVT